MSNYIHEIEVRVTLDDGEDIWVEVKTDSRKGWRQLVEDVKETAMEDCRTFGKRPASAEVNWREVAQLYMEKIENANSLIAELLALVEWEDADGDLFKKADKLAHEMGHRKDQFLSQ